jgi:hypothetical protein
MAPMISTSDSAGEIAPSRMSPPSNVATTAIGARDDTSLMRCGAEHQRGKECLPSWQTDGWNSGRRSSQRRAPFTKTENSTAINIRLITTITAQINCSCRYERSQSDGQRQHGDAKDRPQPLPDQEMAGSRSSCAVDADACAITTLAQTSRMAVMNRIRSDLSFLATVYSLTDLTRSGPIKTFRAPTDTPSG